MIKQAFLTLALLACAPVAMAEETDKYKLTLSGHRFEPASLTIPANTRVKLVVHNKDNNGEEFHSDSLHREKIIGAGKRGIINIGPLAPGVYEFMGEFHATTTRGRIVVR